MDNAMLQNDSRVWVRGSFLISQWHDPGKSSDGSLQHRNSLCTVARSFLPGSHTVHHTVKQLQEKAAGDTVLALDAQQYMQLIDKPTTWCFVQVGKKFQQPAGTTPKQYERAHFMLDRLGLSVSPVPSCSVATC